MLSYRLYFIGEDGHVAGVEPFECETDEAAIELASAKMDGRPSELWRRDRKVMDFSPTSRAGTGLRRT
jgi:hypothetical protein